MNGQALQDRDPDVTWGQLLGMDQWRFPPPPGCGGTRRAGVVLRAARGLAVAVADGDGDGVDRWQAVLADRRRGAHR